jgi:hypothetical protein
MSEYATKFRDKLSFGAEATVFGNGFTPLVSKRISEETSIFPPEEFEKEDFWNSPEQNLQEILVARHLSSKEEIRSYCILPLGYCIDPEKKQIDLIMPRATATISDEFKSLQENPRKHIAHLLEGFLILLNEGILQHDNAGSNIMYLKSEDTYKFIDFGSSYFLNDISTSDDPAKSLTLIKEAYSYLLGTIMFSICGGSNLQTHENPDYIKFQAIVDVLSNEKRSWNLEVLELEKCVLRLKSRVSALIKAFRD